MLFHCLWQFAAKKSLPISGGVLKILEIAELTKISENCQKSLKESFFKKLQKCKNSQQYLGMLKNVPLKLRKMSRFPRMPKNTENCTKVHKKSQKVTKRHKSAHYFRNPKTSNQFVDIKYLIIETHSEYSPHLNKMSFYLRKLINKLVT